MAWENDQHTISELTGYEIQSRAPRVYEASEQRPMKPAVAADICA